MGETQVANEENAARARFFSVEEGFNIKRPGLAPRAFTAERDIAFREHGHTGEILLDCSGELGFQHSATSPLMLACYLRVNAGETLEVARAATGEIHVVLKGAGETRKGGDRVRWHAGDVFCLPGGDAPAEHAADEDAVLYHVCDAPALHFIGAGAPKPGQAPIRAVLYPRAMIDRQIDGLRARQLPADAPGRAVNLSSAEMDGLKTCLPSMTLTYNVVPPGDTQRPHRHNATALVLVQRPGSCRSVVAGRPFDWCENTVILTPATEVHSHVNGPDADWALALIVQDGGLYYHARTMGFAFA